MLRPLLWLCGELPGWVAGEGRWASLGQGKTADVDSEDVPILDCFANRLAPTRLCFLASIGDDGALFRQEHGPPTVVHEPNCVVVNLALTIRGGKRPSKPSHDGVKFRKAKYGEDGSRFAQGAIRGTRRWPSAQSPLLSIDFLSFGHSRFRNVPPRMQNGKRTAAKKKSSVPPFDFLLTGARQWIGFLSATTTPPSMAALSFGSHTAITLGQSCR